MSLLAERFESEAEEKIMKAVFFDLDDTLLWDEKASEQHLQKLAYRRRKNMALPLRNSKQLFAKRRENCTCHMRRIHIQ